MVLPLFFDVAPFSTDLLLCKPRYIYFQVYFHFNYFGSNVFKMSTDFQPREWHHLCWSIDTKTGLNRIFLNGNLSIEGISNYTKTSLPGTPTDAKQFLLLGQEPDDFKGQFDNKQLLRGKLSQLNIWSRNLDGSDVEAMAKCQLDSSTFAGDIVTWSQESFTTNGLKIEQLETENFCSNTKNIIFFPGRRTRSNAEELCGAQGGWVVAPESKEENQLVLDTYLKHKEECIQSNTEVIGWLGSSFYKDRHFSTKFFQARKEVLYNNYMKGYHLSIYYHYFKLSNIHGCPITMAAIL